MKIIILPVEPVRIVDLNQCGSFAGGDVNGVLFPDGLNLLNRWFPDGSQRVIVAPGRERRIGSEQSLSAGETNDTLPVESVAHIRGVSVGVSVASGGSTPGAIVPGRDKTIIRQSGKFLRRQP